MKPCERSLSVLKGEIEAIFSDWDDFTFEYEPDGWHYGPDDSRIQCNVTIRNPRWNKYWSVCLDLICDGEDCEINLYEDIYKDLEDGNVWRKMFWESLDESTQLRADLAEARAKAVELAEAAVDLHFYLPCIADQTWLHGTTERLNSHFRAAKETISKWGKK